MERMSWPFSRDGLRGSRQRLTEYLPTKYCAPTEILALTEIGILPDLFKGQEVKG